VPGLPQSWLGDTVALYGRVFRRGAVLVGRNWLLALVIAASLALLAAAELAAARLGLLGGLLWTLAVMACASSWLALVGQMIRVGRITPADVPGGFVAYLNDLLAVGFLLWVLRLLGELALAPLPLLRIVFGLATTVFFNAVPELIYLGRFGAADLLVASYRFIGENWIEWFPANLALGAIVAGALVGGLPLGVFATLPLGAALAYALVVRGLLFIELTTSSRRARAFRRQAAG
jgi:hypothetical protein